MAIVRGLVATAVFAGGLAVGTAGTAWADLPSMNGSYTETSTSPSGVAVTNDWTVSPCGDGCALVKAGAGSGMAYFRDGQWVLDTMNNLTCADGTFNQFATNAHMTWDPNSLEGTSEISYITGACGHPPGYHQTNHIQLKASSS
jgi:hypothetical protein